MAADVAVIIVTWNVKELVLDALRTLYADLAGSGLTAHVIVVDSASADSTSDAVAKAFPQAQVIASTENLGFSRANNMAMRELGFGRGLAAENLPKAVFLLNPDTLTHTGAVRTLYDVLHAAPDIGLVGPSLTYGDGSFQHGAFMFPGLRQIWTEFFPTPGRFMEGAFNGRYPRTLYAAGKPFAVDFTLGAAMMLRREVIEQTGMFDEGFFMYCEETDWAWRIRRAGWQIMLVPAAHITHLGGQSTTQIRPKSVLNLWTSRMRLYRKYYPRWKVLAAKALVYLGMGRKAREAFHDTSLTPESRAALLDAYEAVQRL